MVELVCFRTPDMDGNYFSATDYTMLYQLAPNIQNAFEELDKALGEAREQIRDRLEKCRP
ncbi:MAG: hypothetical protein JWQ49_1551 [Edaphobacter sp.]|nr:hypothetical protein [Edaphobacter sp.]